MPDKMTEEELRKKMTLARDAFAYDLAKAASQINERSFRTGDITVTFTVPESVLTTLQSLLAHAQAARGTFLPQLTKDILGFLLVKGALKVAEDSLEGGPLSERICELCPDQNTCSHKGDCETTNGKKPDLRLVH